MTDLRQALHDHLTIRRQLGCELKHPGQLLEQYVSFRERAGATRSCVAQWRSCGHDRSLLCVQ